MTYYLNETFFKNRSYTRFWDQFANLPFEIHSTLPNGTYLITNRILTRLIQVQQEEITPITSSKNLH